MHVRSFHYSLPLIVLLLAGASGCGIFGIGAKPKDEHQVFKAFQTAWGANDFGAIYDMFSTESKRRFERALRANNTDLLHGLDAAELQKMTPRDAYIKLFNTLQQRQPDEFDDVARAKLIPPPLKLGDYRTFRRAHPSGRESELNFTLEDGQWLVDVRFVPPATNERRP